MYVVGNTDEVEAAWKPYEPHDHKDQRTSDQGTEKHGNDQPWPDIWLLNVGS
jgi:hypothetical protein